MKKYFKKYAKQSAADLRRELAHTYIVVTLISSVSIVLLLLGSTLEIAFDLNLSVLAMCLLGLLAVISLGNYIFLMMMLSKK
jgi:hypothetical protein